MQINNNIQLDQNAYLNANQALNRIATGSSINSAADNASGLAISDNLNAQASGISQSIDNVNSGIASLQIGDQAIKEQSSILDQVKEKLLQASTDTTSQDGRKALITEIKDLLENFDNIANSTNYNGQTLLQNGFNDTSATQALQFQAGESSGDIIESGSIQSNTQGTGLTALLNQDIETFTSADARGYLETVDNAITTVNSFRAELGSTQNQLQSSSENLLAQYSQTTGAASVISEVNYAQEVANFGKQNILAQIGAFGAAQSNNINQNIVSRLLS
ncbi:MAG: flagellin [Arcobacter sp.]|nr:MAG: flagellin [Arcobacter sp.]